MSVAIHTNAEENALRERICETGASLFNRGLTAGSSGNISARLGDMWLMTPTNASLGALDPARLSKIDGEGRLVSGDPPTKEAPLHHGMYAERPQAGAIVHLHSTYSAAVSCIEGLDAANCIPPLTPYFVMKIGRLPLIPYHPPGASDLAAAVRQRACAHCAVLLANHGPVVSGASLDKATQAIEELEETAKLFLLLRGERTRVLTCEEVKDLETRFGPAGG